MNIQICIHSAPYASNTAFDALSFAKRAISQGHTIKRVFFYFDGVYHGLLTQSPSSDEYALPSEWQALAEMGVPLQLCIAASTLRGIQETDSDNQTNTLLDGFELTGLGQWASGYHDCDQQVVFK